MLPKAGHWADLPYLYGIQFKNLMMKRFILLILLFITGNGLVKAQQPPTHIPLMTPTWKLIAEKGYKQNKDFKYVANFPTKLKIMQQKEIELPGYVIPISADFEHKKFMLAVVPYDQCPFCGQGDIPSMVEVHMLKPLPHTDKPVKIKGKLILNSSGDKRSEVFLMNASLVKE